MSLLSTRRPGRRRPSPRPVAAADTMPAYVPRHSADPELMGQVTKPIRFEAFTAVPNPPSNPPVPAPEPEEEDEPAADVRPGRIRSALDLIKRNLPNRFAR